jgi:hypothetical protein
MVRKQYQVQPLGPNVAGAFVCFLFLFFCFFLREISGSLVCYLQMTMVEFFRYVDMELSGMLLANESRDEDEVFMYGKGNDKLQDHTRPERTPWHTYACTHHRPRTPLLPTVPPRPIR